jgi:hypothetical protein
MAISFRDEAARSSLRPVSFLVHRPSTPCPDRVGVREAVPLPFSDFFLYRMRAIAARHLDVHILSRRIGSGTEVEGVPNLYKVAMPF